MNKRELSVPENPGYEQVIEGNPNFKGVQMDDDDTKKMLCVHIILEANNFVKICTGEWLQVGCQEILLLSLPGLDRQLCCLGLIVAYPLPC